MEGDNPTNGHSTQNRRICAYFQTIRGCVKGNACDFMHPLPESLPNIPAMGNHAAMPHGMPGRGDMPHGMPGRGDMPHGIHGMPGRGDMPHGIHGMPGRGDMQGGGDLHPNASFGRGDGQNKRECSFYLTPRGCAKGDACDFAHINRDQVADPFAMYGIGGGGMGGGGMGGGGMGGRFPHHAMMHPAGRGGMFPGMAGRGGMFPGMAAHMMGAGAGQVGNQYGIGRGGAIVPKKPKPCEFFNSERGCVKGERCDFVHQKDKVCDFYLSDRGCRKGDFCDFKHPEKKSDGTEISRTRTVRKTDKVCSFYLSERGCRKGKLCDFQHPEDNVEHTIEDNLDDREKDKKRESIRYKPY